MSGQARETMQPLVPPRYANVAIASLYDPDLPNSLKVVLGQIEGLTWQNKIRETPPLTVYELACICNLGVRQMWRDLDELEERGWLLVKRQRRWQMVLQTRLPSDPRSESAVEQPVLAANLAALAEFQVRVAEPLAQQIAALPHVTPDLIRAWGRSLQGRRGIRNLPGLLLHMLQVTDSPPRPGLDLRPACGVGRSGASAGWQAPLPEPDSAADQTGPSPAGLPDGQSCGGGSTLPAALRQAVRGLGWEGDLGEVDEIVARDGDGGQRVRAWVQQVTRRRDRYTNPAGFLRTVLRGEDWPEEEKAHEPERGQPSWSENIGDRLDVV